MSGNAYYKIIIGHVIAMLAVLIAVVESGSGIDSLALWASVFVFCSLVGFTLNAGMVAFDDEKPIATFNFRDEVQKLREHNVDERKTAQKEYEQALSDLRNGYEDNMRRLQ